MAQESTNLSTTSETVLQTVRPLSNDGRESVIFDDLLMSIGEYTNSALKSIAESNSKIIKEYIRGNITREDIASQLSPGTNPNDIYTILDKADALITEQGNKYVDSDPFPETSQSISTSTSVSATESTTALAVEESVEPSNPTMATVTTESASLDPDVGAEPPKSEPPLMPTIRPRDPEKTAMLTYVLADAFAALGEMPAMYSNPGIRPFEAGHVYQQAVTSQMAAIGAEMRELDSSRLTESLAAGLAPMFGLEDDEALGLAQSISYITQGLTVATSPDVIAMVEAKSPKLAEMLRAANNFIGGNFGTAAEFNTIINTGQYGAGTAQLVSAQVRKGVEDLDRGSDALGLKPKEFNFRQYGSTLDFLKKTSGYQFEATTGITEGVASKEYFAAYHTPFANAGRQAYIDKYNELHPGEAPEKVEQLADAWVASYIEENATKDLLEQGNNVGPYGNDTLDNERLRLEKLTSSRRKLGQSAWTIMSGEAKQELMKAAGNDQGMAEMMAADRVLSMYGGQALESGDFETAIKQTQTLMHTAFKAGLGDADIEAQAKAIGTALGPEDVAMMPAALNASLMVQRDMQRRGVYLDQKARAEIDQQLVDAIQTKDAGDIAWFMGLKINPDDKTGLAGLQARLKSGEALTSADLEILSRWGRNRSEFVRDVATATGMTTGKVTARLDDNTRQTAMIQAGEQGQMSAILAARQMQIQAGNEELYTPGAVHTRVSAYEEDLSDLGDVDTISGAIQKLGAAGIDWSSVLQGSATNETLAAAQEIIGDSPLWGNIEKRTAEFRDKFKTAREVDHKSVEEARRAATDTQEAHAIQFLDSQINERAYNPNTAILENQNISIVGTQQEVAKSVEIQQEAPTKLPTSGPDAIRQGGVAGGFVNFFGFEPTPEQYKSMQRDAGKWEQYPLLQMFNTFARPLESFSGQAVDWFSGFMFPSAPQRENGAKPDTEPKSADVSQSGGHIGGLPVSIVDVRLPASLLSQLASLTTSYTTSSNA